MAYKDFPSKRDKLAMQFYGLKWKDLSDEQKYDVQKALILEAHLKRMAGF